MAAVELIVMTKEERREMKKRYLLTIIILITTTSPGLCGNVDTFGIGAKATALGGAFAAYADDPSAVYYNPAGLSQSNTKKFSLGTLSLLPDIQIKDFEVKSPTQKALNERQDQNINHPKDFSNESKLLVIPNLGYTMPINDRISAGFAVYVPWGVELDWDDNPYNNPAAFNAYHVYLVTESFSPCVAYKVNDKLSIGASFSISKSETGMEKFLYIASDMGHIERQATHIAENDIFKGIEKQAGIPIKSSSMAAAALKLSGSNDPFTVNLMNLFSSLAAGGIETADQIGNYFSNIYDGIPAKDHGSKVEVELTDNFHWSMNFGVLYQPNKRLTLGVTYRSHSDVSYDGEIKMTHPVTRAEIISQAQMDYKHPDQIQAGLRYRPKFGISMEMDVVWTKWSVMDKQTTRLDQPLEIHVLPGNIIADTTILDFELERDWSDTLQLRFGFEWQQNPFVTWRAGYFYDPTPIPDDTMDFQWSDGDKKVYSLGVGIQGALLSKGNKNSFLNRLSVDGVFQYGRSEHKRVVGGESHNLNHDFDVTEFYDRHVYMKATGCVWGLGFSFNLAL